MNFIHWNYRVCKRTVSEESLEDLVEYSIREVYYNEDGSIHAYSSVALDFTFLTYQDMDVEKEALDDFQFDAIRAIQALSKEVVDLDVVDKEFVAGNA